MDMAEEQGEPGTNERKDESKLKSKLNTGNLPNSPFWNPTTQRTLFEQQRAPSFSDPITSQPVQVPRRAKQNSNDVAMSQDPTVFIFAPPEVRIGLQALHPHLAGKPIAITQPDGTIKNITYPREFKEVTLWHLQLITRNQSKNASEPTSPDETIADGISPVIQRALRHLVSLCQITGSAWTTHIGGRPLPTPQLSFLVDQSPPQHHDQRLDGTGNLYHIYPEAEEAKSEIESEIREQKTNDAGTESKKKFAPERQSALDDFLRRRRLPVRESKLIPFAKAQEEYQTQQLLENNLENNDKHYLSGSRYQMFSDKRGEDKEAVDTEPYIEHIANMVVAEVINASTIAKVHGKKTHCKIGAIGMGDFMSATDLQRKGELYAAYTPALYQGILRGLAKLRLHKKNITAIKSISFPHLEFWGDVTQQYRDSIHGETSGKLQETLIKVKTLPALEPSNQPLEPNYEERWGSVHYPLVKQGKKAYESYWLNLKAMEFFRAQAVSLGKELGIDVLSFSGEVDALKRLPQRESQESSTNQADEKELKSDTQEARKIPPKSVAYPVTSFTFSDPAALPGGNDATMRENHLGKLNPFCANMNDQLEFLGIYLDYRDPDQGQKLQAAMEIYGARIRMAQMRFCSKQEYVNKQQEVGNPRWKYLWLLVPLVATTFAGGVMVPAALKSEFRIVDLDPKQLLAMSLTLIVMTLVFSFYIYALTPNYQELQQRAETAKARKDQVEQIDQQVFTRMLENDSSLSDIQAEPNKDEISVYLDSTGHLEWLNSDSTADQWCEYLQNEPLMQALNQDRNYKAEVKTAQTLLTRAVQGLDNSSSFAEDLAEATDEVNQAVLAWHEHEIAEATNCCKEGFKQVAMTLGLQPGIDTFDMQVSGGPYSNLLSAVQRRETEIARQAKIKATATQWSLSDFIEYLGNTDNSTQLGKLQQKVQKKVDLIIQDARKVASKEIAEEEEYLVTLNLSRSDTRPDTPEEVNGSNNNTEVPDDSNATGGSLNTNLASV